jgi:hypothetical protein
MFKIIVIFTMTLVLAYLHTTVHREASAVEKHNHDFVSRPSAPNVRGTKGGNQYMASYMISSVPREHSSTSAYSSPASQLHIVCSSDCSTYQRWQVITQVQSARAVQQAGNYTWLVSGCSGEDEADVRTFVTMTIPRAGTFVYISLGLWAASDVTIIMFA